MRRVHKNLCPATTSASIMAANMWKNSLKNIECDNNKISYETLLDFFLQRNGTYILNKPRIRIYVCMYVNYLHLLSVVLTPVHNFCSMRCHGDWS